jgi:hypothetical protein
VHLVTLGFPEINGTGLSIAAAPGTRWSVLVSSDVPPVRFAEVPGWTSVGGAGPDLHFNFHEISFSSGGVEGGGRLMVVIECAYDDTEQIQVRVSLKEPLGEDYRTFKADCSPTGERTTQVYATDDDGFIVAHDVPAGSWTAMTVLIPDQP